jgi:O-acetyl-ADP-ribose deacetylase (regulator of RNase III)
VTKISPEMRLRLCVGDLAAWPGVDAVVVSANRTLQGNASPSYWRFAGRDSVDGAVRVAAGDELAQHCAALSVCCEAGEAVATPAFGALARRGCRNIVHVVVPDGLQVHAGSSDRHVQRTSLPLLRQSFSAALAAAAGCGARSVAMPALGCGVNGWPHAVAAEAAICALTVATPAEGSCSGTLETVDLVLRTEAAAQHWLDAVGSALGPPRTDESQSPLPRKRAVASWDLIEQRSAGRRWPSQRLSAGADSRITGGSSCDVDNAVRRRAAAQQGSASKRALLVHRTLEQVRQNVRRR